MMLPAPWSSGAGGRGSGSCPLRGTVLGAEGVNADRTVDGDLSEEAGGPSRPEVLRSGGSSFDTGLGQLGPVRRFDVVFVCERLRESPR